MMDDMRMTFAEALDLMVESLLQHAVGIRHWIIAFSGGKDSSALVTLILYLIEIGRIPRPESLTILYADTRMELPPLQAAARGIMREARRRGFIARTVLPPLDHRFFVYMIGRGIPPPNNHFRWCTEKLKVLPMADVWVRMFGRLGEKMLVLTGVRLGESAARDSRIALSCSRDGAECGQGWFQEAAPADICATLAPLLHFRVCHVWDWLMFDAPKHGFPTETIADAYGGDEAQEQGARTGCFGCNLVEEDRALELTLRNPRWKYLAPLRGLRPIYKLAQQPQNRLVAIERRKTDGTLMHRNGKLGAIHIEHRRAMLRAVLAVQDEINSGRGRMPKVVLINEQELARIEELLEAGTYPQGWTGEEPHGDVWIEAELETDRDDNQLILPAMPQSEVDPALINLATQYKVLRPRRKRRRR